MNLKKLLCFATVLIALASQASASRILMVCAFPGKSHFMMHKATVKELVNRGHEVTFITNFSMGKNMGANYTEVLIAPIYDFWADIQDHFQATNLFELSSLSLGGFLTMIQIIGEKTTEYALQQPKVMEIFNRTDTDGVYDLLISELFSQEAFLALAVKYNIPVITTTTLGFESYMSQEFGFVSPWSYVPHSFMPFDDKMTFWERIRNSFSSLYQDLHREFVTFPRQDALVKKYLSHLPMKIPPVSQMEKNVSAVLLNSHAPLTTTRPSLPSMIAVGGMHIYPPKPLPADIQKFLDEAHDGAIYFSLGSNVQSADMPPEKLKIFLDVFAGMKQRVLWKFEADNIPHLPKNVMINKWMPQSDILAHPNVKVFITHGGLFGSQEGVHYAVPMLGIPIYCDQYLNMKKATKAGYAITLHFPSITEDLLRDSLKDLLENPSYKTNIQRISQIFRDRPMSARDTAMYWIEYVIRYKGAPQIRSAGLDLAWYEFYLLDVVGALLLAVLVAVFGVVWIVRTVLGSGKQIKQKRN